jgi:hypothetical protein
MSLFGHDNDHDDELQYTFERSHVKGLFAPIVKTRWGAKVSVRPVMTQLLIIACGLLALHYARADARYVPLGAFTITFWYIVATIGSIILLTIWRVILHMFSSKSPPATDAGSRLTRWIFGSAFDFLFLMLSFLAIYAKVLYP